ncbi:MAG: hypothetical protein R8G66_13280 [Cytophagales bacterium]|nr:hypothetical protein [Cytophagales bacterium]
MISNPPNAYTGHPSLGIQLNEGVFDITVNDQLTFHATHEPGGYRNVSKAPRTAQADVWMLGCSYTYGYGVNDEENFTSLLQNRYPRVHFRNAGVIGHGTVQALMRLKKMMIQGHPKMVLLNFSSYHFMRNTLSQQYRSHLKIGYSRASKSAQQQMAVARFPFMRSCENSLQLVAWDDIYDHWPGRESLATVHSMQKTYDRLLEDVDQQIEVAACLIQEMAQICKDNGVIFHVVCLDRSPATQQLKMKTGNIPWLDVGYSFSDTTMTNHPYDDHPNPKGHRFIADQIDQHLAPAFQKLSQTTLSEL